MMVDYDIGIVGAGPLGLELAIALKQAGVRYIQFDKGQAAEAIYRFPPQTPFYSSSERIGIGGIPVQTVDQQKCTREAYLAYIRSVCMKFHLTINTYEEVVGIEKENGFLLRTQSVYGEYQYRVKFVVFATGGTSFPRVLGIPGEALGHVTDKLEDPHKYFGRNLMIVGGKNSAVEGALRGFHAGAKVTIVMRGGEFDQKAVKYWLLPELLGRIKRKEIVCRFESEIAEIQPGYVVLKSKERLQADFVVKAIGFKADMKLFKSLGIAMKENSEAPVYDPQTMETTLEGIYVLGTVIGGTQESYRVYIENTHHHVGKIMNDLAQKLKIESQGQSWVSDALFYSGPPEE
jgi:thioredoxin reductase (NADPH)